MRAVVVPTDRPQGRPPLRGYRRGGAASEVSALDPPASVYGAGGFMSNLSCVKICGVWLPCWGPYLWSDSHTTRPTHVRSACEACASYIQGKKRTPTRERGVQNTPGSGCQPAGARPHDYTQANEHELERKHIHTTTPNHQHHRMMGPARQPRTMLDEKERLGARPPGAKADERNTTTQR